MLEKENKKVNWELLDNEQNNVWFKSLVMLRQKTLSLEKILYIFFTFC